MTEVPSAPELIPAPTVPRPEQIVRDLLGIRPEDNVSFPRGEQATSIFEQVERLSFDPGVGRERIFTPPGKSEPERAEAVTMLRRPAFVRLSTADGQVPGVVLMGDMGKLRRADFALDPAGNKSADLALNRFNGAVNRVAERFIRPGRSVVTCRYGGDEVAMGMKGEWSPAELDEFEAAVAAEIEAQKAYYTDSPTPTADPSRITEGNIELKVGPDGRKLQKIVAPEASVNGGVDREMYEWFFKRGLILDEENMGLIKAQWDAAGQDHRAAFEDYKAKNADNIFPEDIRNESDHVEQVRKKVMFLREKHPEFSLLFGMARPLDAQVSADTVSHREAVCDFIEQVVYDQLMGEHFYTFEDFQHNINSGMIDKVHVLDMKFIKEINDTVGLVKGDEAIKEFWDNVRKYLTPDDYKHLLLGRRGGTFFIGERIGDNGPVFDKLSDSAKSLLRGEMRRATVNNTDLPVSFASGEVSQRGRRFNLDLASITERADERWYDDIFSDLQGVTVPVTVQGQESQMPILIAIGGGHVRPDDFSTFNPDGSYNPASLLVKYFASEKRGEERMAKLAEQGRDLDLR